jgi:hypothetical protein
MLPLRFVSRLYFVFIHVWVCISSLTLALEELKFYRGFVWMTLITRHTRVCSGGGEWIKSTCAEITQNERRPALERRMHECARNMWWNANTRCRQQPLSLCSLCPLTLALRSFACSGPSFLRTTGQSGCEHQRRRHTTLTWQAKHVYGNYQNIALWCREWLLWPLLLSPKY